MGKPTNPRPIAAPTRRPNLKHGAYTLQKAVTVLGSRALPPKSTALGRELRAWRDSLIADLGGEETITTQQRALVDLAVRSKLLVDSVDAYVLGMDSPVNKRRRCLHPVVRERQALADSLARYMGQLGLERRAKQLDIAAQLAALHRPPATVVQSGDRGTTGHREEAARPAGPVVGEPEKEKP
jgi:hypothetical protein